MKKIIIFPIIFLVLVMSLVFATTIRDTTSEFLNVIIEDTATITKNLFIGSGTEWLSIYLDGSTGYFNTTYPLVITNSVKILDDLQLGDVGGGPKQIMIHADGDALTLKQDVEGDDIYQTWYTAGGVRRGFFGYGQGSNNNLTLSNEVGGITFTGIDEDDVGIEDGKYLILLNDPDTAIGKQKGLAFGRSDNFIVAGIEPHIPAGGGGHLDFYTAALDNSLSVAMRIDQDGNVGIGTTTPKATLNVVGDVYHNL